MPVIRPTALLANAVWWLSLMPSALRFRRALQHPGAAQARLLRGILVRNAGTAYGRECGFAAIRSADEFRKRVPLVDYADLAPWIKRIMAGEPRVLTRDRVERLVPTSGTADGAKWIPHTATLRRQFQAAIAPWIWHLYRDRPGLMGGTAYWSVTPVTPPPPVDSRVPVGFDSDSDYVGPWRRWLMRAILAVGDKVAGAPSPEAFWAATVDALRRRDDLRLISVWHPSFLRILLEKAEGAAPGCWPALGLVSCWTDGAAAMSARELEQLLPGVEIQPKGLLATEAFVSLPLGKWHPLAVRSHFFEFLDESGTPHLADGLEEGRVYSVVVTTGGGLYRYRLHDRVRVNGFAGRTPSVRFLGKESRFSDICGEKLAEEFANTALTAALGDIMPAVRFAMLAPDSGRARYVLFIEADGGIAAGLAGRVDEALCRNPHYRHCREIGQLERVAVFHITGDAHIAFLDAETENGRRLGNIKPTCLSPRRGWESRFAGGYLPGLDG